MFVCTCFPGRSSRLFGYTEKYGSASEVNRLVHHLPRGAAGRETVMRELCGGYAESTVMQALLGGGNITVMRELCGGNAGTL